MALRHRVLVTGLGSMMILLATVASSHGAVTVSTAFNSTTGFPGITAWPIAPTVDTTTAAANPGVFIVVPEGDFGFGDPFAAANSLAQSFVATADGKLTSVQIAVTGNIATAPTFQMNVFEVVNGDFTDISCYDPDANMSCDPFVPGSTDISNNLLTDTSPHSWGQYTLEGANAAVLNMALTGADQVDIVTGRTYIVEFQVQTDPQNTILWGRMANNAFNYVDGQAFRARTPLNGNAARDMAMAVTIATPGQPGDFDDDGDVDGRDYLIWQRGNSPSPLSATDLAAWQTNFGAGGLASFSAIPEPNTLLLALGVTVIIVGNRRNYFGE